MNCVGACGPSAFQAAADGVLGVALAALVGPAEVLLLDGGSGRLGTHALGRLARAVGLAEGVAAGDQGDGLFIVHGHLAEGHADLLGGRERVRVAAGTFRIHVDEAHLGGGEGVFQLPFRVEALPTQHVGFRAPVDEIRLPIVRPAASEAEGLEAHVLHGDGTGQHHQVGPGDVAAVLLLDRPEQAPRLVEVDVVGPAVQRIEALLAAAGAAAPVSDAVGSGAVPGHADKQRAVVAKVGRPPVLGGGHQFLEVLLDGREVEAGEGRGVVEVRAVGAGRRVVVAQGLEVELIRPPELVGPRLAGRHGWVCSHRRGEHGSQDGCGIAFMSMETISSFLVSSTVGRKETPELVIRAAFHVVMKRHPEFLFTASTGLPRFCVAATGF